MPCTLKYFLCHRTRILSRILRFLRGSQGERKHSQRYAHLSVADKPPDDSSRCMRIASCATCTKMYVMCDTVTGWCVCVYTPFASLTNPATAKRLRPTTQQQSSSDAGAERLLSTQKHTRSIYPHNLAAHSHRGVLGVISGRLLEAGFLFVRSAIHTLAVIECERCACCV